MTEPWLEVLIGISLCASFVGMAYMSSALRKREIAVSQWEQWTNLGHFLALIRNEREPILRRRYKTILGLIGFSYASLFAEFIVMVRIEIHPNQAALPTTTTVTPPAGQEARRP